MLIKTIDRSTKDVFLGKGWLNWVRYAKTSKGWEPVKGLRPNKETHEQIVKKITEWEAERAKKHQQKQKESK